MKVECHGRRLPWEPSSTGSEDMYEAHCPVCAKYVVLEARSDPDFLEETPPVCVQDAIPPGDSNVEVTLFVPPRNAPTSVHLTIRPA